MAQELAKAKVKVLDGRNKDQEFAVIFNPTEYSLEIANSFQEAAPPGLSNPDHPVRERADPGPDHGPAVRHLHGRRREPTSPSGPKRSPKCWRSTATFHAPPRVEFKWGVFSFKAVVEKLSQRFTMFLSDGTPVRATLNVTFKQFRSLSEQLEQPRRNSADKTKRRVFTSDDSLWHLAFREFREPKYWRLIARRNQIDDPFAVEPGDALVVPPLEEIDTRDAAK